MYMYSCAPAHCYIMDKVCLYIQLLPQVLIYYDHLLLTVTMLAEIFSPLTTNPYRVFLLI